MYNPFDLMMTSRFFQSRDISELIEAMTDDTDETGCQDQIGLEDHDADLAAEMLAVDRAHLDTLVKR